MPMPDRDKDVEKLLRVLEKPAAQARLRELLGPPSSTLPASGEGMREVYLRERGWVTYDGEGWLYLNGGERHTLQQAFDREWTRLRPATVVAQENRWQANPVRPDRATRLSQALAEMHEAHRRVKKANRTQAQTISKLQADLKAMAANRDGAIENARASVEWQASHDGLNWGAPVDLAAAVDGWRYARAVVTLPVDIDSLRAVPGDV